MASTKPHIPKNVLRRLLCLQTMKGFSSMVLDFDEIRQGIVNLQVGLDMTVRDILGKDRIPPAQQENLNVTWLQYAARTGDIPLAYEMIRFGANIEVKDNERGQTALNMAYERYLESQSPTRRMRFPHIDGVSELVQVGSRAREIALMLVEQHANIDVTFDEDLKVTILHMACMVKDWDFVGLLIRHGAREKMNVYGYLPSDILTPEEQNRFKQILSAAPTQRAPRMCPCWSGEILLECHAKEPKPYPSEFLCRCRSGKSHKRCCEGRNFDRMEVWNAKEGWIQPMDIPSPGFSTGGRDSLRTYLASMPASLQLGAAANLKAIHDVYFDAHLSSDVDALVSKNIVDPAFAWAVKRSRWIPRPLGPIRSKPHMAAHAEKFNGYVDEYIRKGIDSRPKPVIERAAKIHPSGGALYKVCEGPGCKMQEDGGSISFKRCGKCRLAFYCGVDCQRAHWKGHKITCCSPSQTERALPSQKVMQEHIITPLVDGTDHNTEKLEYYDEVVAQLLQSEGSN
ncbi:hypothetical protein BD410DRAFT_786286 [Rickenella mellea]|uniref:MYND-type domain-containing protein n=1 Tax=Rickenella mellea TaxID=50990 RepID=A0A4Y7Q9R0_9AGAM|nr:hypothetical protein BD410DRAFT_786286 [Rickenella mellea]